MKKRHHVAMNIYWFGIAFMWNGLHPIVLPAILVRLAPEQLKNTYLGGITFAGLVLAMIVQPLAGGLSDRTRSRWGRRRPWMLAGTLFSLACLGAMAVADSLALLLSTYLLLQIASNSAHGPAQGLVPDLVPEEERGLASGAKNLFDMLGLVVASLVAGRLMSDGSPILAFASIGGVLALCTLATSAFTREMRTGGPGETPSAPRPAAQRLRETLGVDLRRHPGFSWLIVSRFLILVGVTAVQVFAQYYVRDVLQDPDPAGTTGTLMAAIGVPLTLLVAPAGLLADRIGRRRLTLLAGGLITPGLLLLLLARSVPSLMAIGALIGVGTGIFLSADWALALEIIPQEEAGKYLGLTNLATAGASAAARLAGPLIDGGNALRPGAYLGYPALFVLASACALAGTLLVRRIGTRQDR